MRIRLRQNSGNTFIRSVPGASPPFRAGAGFFMRPTEKLAGKSAIMFNSRRPSFGNFDQFIWHESRIGQGSSPPRFAGFRAAWNHLKQLPVFRELWEKASYEYRIAWLRNQIEWLRHDSERDELRKKNADRDARKAGELMAICI